MTVQIDVHTRSCFNIQAIFHITVYILYFLIFLISGNSEFGPAGGGGL
jgi:hypothetical protein